MSLTCCETARGSPGCSATSAEQLGHYVSTAGDINGDGLDDFIIGASQNDAGGGNAGRAFIYDCSRFHVLTPEAGAVWNVGAEESITWSGAALGDVWLSVDGGNAYELLESGVGGREHNA